MDIPFERLFIPQDFRKNVLPDAPKQVRMAVARGLLPCTPDVLLGMLYVLSTQEDKEVRDAVVRTLMDLPPSRILNGISQATHSKVLELITTLRADDQEVAGGIIGIRNANDRTAVLIAEKAGPELCERIVYNQERLLMTPQVFVALHANPCCDEVFLERAGSFLRMQQCLPPVPAERPFNKPIADAEPPPPPEMDLEAEIEAALGGRTSPSLETRTQQALQMFDLDNLKLEDKLLSAFHFDFKDDMSSFSWDLTEEKDDNANPEERLSLERKVGAMSVGQKIKLAYLGNKEVRALLVRDRNKLVATAVVKSGRCTDGEIANMAGNRNLHDDVLREIATRPEFTRKYPVRVALVNNPKTPVSVAVSMVTGLQKKDLSDLTRNHNVPSVVNQLAVRLFKQKYKAG